MSRLKLRNDGSSARDMECQTDGPEKKDVSTQCERYRRRSKEVRTTKYMEGGREVVIVQETEEFFQHVKNLMRSCDVLT